MWAVAALLLSASKQHSTSHDDDVAQFTIDGEVILEVGLCRFWRQPADKNFAAECTSEQNVCAVSPCLPGVGGGTRQ